MNCSANGALTPEMAVRLGHFFGNSPGFWLKAQRAVDLWDVTRVKKNIARIRPINTSSH